MSITEGPGPPARKPPALRLSNWKPHQLQHVGDQCNHPLNPCSLNHYYTLGPRDPKQMEHAHMNIPMSAHKDTYTHTHTLFRAPGSWLRLAKNRQSNNHAKIEAKSSNRDEKTLDSLNS